jgi:hypothetical protein
MKAFPSFRPYRAHMGLEKLAEAAERALRSPRFAGAVAAALLLFTALSAQTKSPKRGICGDASDKDLAAVAPYVSWYYNWSIEPPSVSKGALSGIEWVPMQWGGISADKVTAIQSKIPAGCRFLLGFNEPNFKSQANLTPAQAAAAWPHVEAMAKNKGLALVAPAVNWCGGCVDGVTNDPTDWLDKFIAACPDCRFDYIAVHNYNSYVSVLKSYIDKFRKYKKPIWLTEFASWDDPVDDDGVVKYMKEAVAYLETEPLVFRYSWFATRVKSNPNLDLLGENGALTELGKLYATLPFNKDKVLLNFPVGRREGDLGNDCISVKSTVQGLTVLVPGLREAVRLAVVDCSGKVVYNGWVGPCRTGAAIDTRTFRSGAYLLTVCGGPNRFEKKLVTLR